MYVYLLLVFNQHFFFGSSSHFSEEMPLVGPLKKSVEHPPAHCRLKTMETRHNGASIFWFFQFGKGFFLYARVFKVRVVYNKFEREGGNDLRHLTLGVDIDGTIKDTHTAAVQVFNREFQKSYQPEEIKEFYLDRPYGLTREEGFSAWSRLETEIYDIGLPLQNAPNVLQKLAEQGHQIYYITARPDRDDIREVTSRWLQRHGFPFQADRLLMGSHQKEKVAKKVGVDLFFEDAPDYLENLIRDEVDVIISDCVYNRDYKPEHRRFTDWNQVYEIVEQKMQELEGKETK